MILSFTKNQINYYPLRSLDELVELVSNTFTLEEYEQSRFNPLKFRGNGESDWGDNNVNTTPREWISIYKYSKDYGNFPVQTNHVPEDWGGNVLDFGAGNGTPWINIPEDVNLYLLEINLAMAENLKNNYQSQPNVKVVTSLQDIKDIKFDHIYSKDVLEHVRNVNEHIEIFYYIGNPNCSYYLEIDEAPSAGHVLNLHSDTIINNLWIV